ncbi:MAG TPA: YetF domain-containing protein [Candidatus Elarobacter sp.]|nr:YetF domain-containing protein [Candidatus Elarobacter sp.]
MSPIATDLWIPGVPVIEKVVRSIVVYLFLVVILRIAGKRTLGQLTSFDLVVLLLLSNTVQNAIIGNDNSLSGGLLGAAVLIAFNYIVVRTLYNHRKAERALEGGTAVLMHHGQFRDDVMKRQLITHAELMAAARRQGITRMSDIRVARLEVGGSVTFELEMPTEEERNVADILARLERIETLLGGLNDGRRETSTQV